MQKRRWSLTESFVNILVGYSINLAANFIIFPLWGWTITVKQNLEIGVIYTLISLARSYLLRRAFTHLTEKTNG